MLKTLLLVWAAQGIFLYYHFEQPDGLMQYAFAFTNLILVYLWCGYDAAERGKKIGTATAALLVVLLVVGWPLYAFQSRGWSGLKLLGWGFLTVFSLFATMITTWIITGIIDGWQVVELVPQIE